MADLLAQIKQLLDEYLAQGEDTPVAAEAQALAAAIDSVGAEDQGATPGLPSPDEELPPEGGPPPGPMPSGSDQAIAEMMPSSPPTSFADASSMALEDMKKRRPKGY